MKFKGIVTALIVAVVGILFGMTSLASEWQIDVNSDGIKEDSAIQLGDTIAKEDRISVNCHYDVDMSKPVYFYLDDEIMPGLFKGVTVSKWKYSGEDTITLSEVTVDEEGINIYFTSPVPTPVINPASESTAILTVKKWVPSTVEEIYQYSLKCKAPVIAESDDKNVVIVNEIQGQACLDVFKDACKLNGYTLGYTYNIYEKNVSTTVYTFADGKERTSTLTIPKDLQKEGRTFMMICVSENGFAYTFKDTDQDAATITFTYDRLYAYALVYKD